MEITKPSSAIKRLAGDMKNGGNFINMINVNKVRICPHCGNKMSKWATPQLPFGGSTTWTSEFLYVCFNDECPYFVNGWDWIWNNYHRKASYRHALDPTTGQTCPVPVKSKIALRDCIIEE